MPVTSPAKQLKGTEFAAFQNNHRIFKLKAGFPFYLLALRVTIKDKKKKKNFFLKTKTFNKTEFKQ